MSFNTVVPKEANLNIDWFHCIKIQKSSVSIAPFSKFEWFNGTTGTTTNAGPEYNLIFIVNNVVIVLESLGYGDETQYSRVPNISVGRNKCVGRKICRKLIIM